MPTLMPTFGWLDLPEYRGWVPGDPDPVPRTSLLEPGMEGERLLLTGHVLTRLGAPIADAKIEFWQADSAGKYHLAEYKLTGRQRTGANGSFTLETIMPGYAGPIRHINYLVTATRAGRKQPLHLRAAIYFATDDELGRPITATERPYVRPGARTHHDDPAFLPMYAMPIENGVRRASYDIVFDVD